MVNSAVMNAAQKLSGSLDDLLSREDAEAVLVDLDDIEILPQDREVFEDDENTLAELGASLRKRQIQPIVLRRTPAGRKHGKPFELVAGERRVRGGRLEGLPQLLALIFDLTDEEARDLQLAENIHRLNLSQLEEAKRLKRDVDELGSIEAVLAKHNKSKSWLSKRLALLDLPPQAKRLITENITADKEVIGQVRTIEKRDPEKAREAVDAIKARGPKGDARAIAAAAKEAVKPSTKEKKAPAPPWSQGGDGAATGSLATAPDLQHQAPGVVSIFPAPPLKPYQRVLREAFDAVTTQSRKAEAVVSGMRDEDKDLAMAHLQSIFIRGGKAVGLSQGVIAGLRAGEFGSTGESALALAAFVQGFEKKPALDLVEILEAVHSACS
jgi:ParB family chromosome partitioning protein